MLLYTITNQCLSYQGGHSWLLKWLRCLGHELGKSQTHYFMWFEFQENITGSSQDGHISRGEMAAVFGYFPISHILLNFVPSLLNMNSHCRTEDLLRAMMLQHCRWHYLHYNSCQPDPGNWATWPCPVFMFPNVFPFW